MIPTRNFKPKPSVNPKYLEQKDKGWSVVYLFFYLAIVAAGFLFVAGLIILMAKQDAESISQFIGVLIQVPFLLAGAYAYKTIALGVLISRDLLIEQEERRIAELNNPKE